MLGVDLKTNTKKNYVEKKLDYVLMFLNHSRYSSQHNWEIPI
jgi:hypothetical protein